MPNTITISGFNEFQGKLERLSREFPQDLDDLSMKAAESWVQLASRTAPRDFGKLAGQIDKKPGSKSGEWEVVSTKEYSAYMEWGTKSRANVPSDLQGYASQFRGPGTGTGAKELIYAWVLRKGLSKDAQWPIFISIMRNGVRPHPFFFIHMPVIEKQLIGDLKQLIESID